MPSPDQMGSPFPAARAMPLSDGYGGKITAYDELPIHALGDDYAVEGNGTVTRLPVLPAGMRVDLRMIGAPTFKNSTRLICPNGVDYVASAGDLAIVRSDGDGVWRLFVLPASGDALLDRSLSPTSTQQSNARANIFAAPFDMQINNKFRNGTMDIWQRGTSSITVTTAGAYTADGWIVTPTGASCTAVQAGNSRNPGASTRFGLQMTGATSVTDITLLQRLESSIAATIASRTVTIQAQVLNSTGGSITPTLSTKSAGSTDVWTSPVNDLAATNLQACANGVWTQVCYTLAVSAVANAGYEFILDFGNNFSTTGKNVIVTELDVRITPGVATGLNSNPPPPELRKIGDELAFCLRYYRQTTGVTNSEPTIYGYGAAGQTLGISIPFPAPMRATPTITSSGTWAVSNCSQPTLNATDVNGYLAFVTVTALGATTLQPNSSGKVFFTAEL